MAKAGSGGGMAAEVLASLSREAPRVAQTKADGAKPYFSFGTWCEWCDVIFFSFGIWCVRGFVLLA